MSSQWEVEARTRYEQKLMEEQERNRHVEALRKSEQNFIWRIIILVVFILCLSVTAFMAGYPQYNVWEKGLVGQAELKRAEQNRQIAVEEARAKMEAAKFLNQAEIIRAEGVAAANKIIGDGLKGNEEYLRYLWIQTLSQGGADKGSTIIYVPTEANIPIMEAGRRK